MLKGKLLADPYSGQLGRRYEPCPSTTRAARQVRQLHHYVILWSWIQLFTGLRLIEHPADLFLRLKQVHFSLRSSTES